MRTCQNLQFVMYIALLVACDNSPGAETNISVTDPADCGVPHDDQDAGSSPDANVQLQDAGSSAPDAAHTEPDAGMQADAGRSADPNCTPGVRAYSFLTHPGLGFTYEAGAPSAQLIGYAVMACEEIDVITAIASLTIDSENAQSPQAPRDPTGFILQDGSPALTNPRMMLGYGIGNVPATQNQELLLLDDATAYIQINMSAFGQPQRHFMPGDYMNITLWVDISENVTSENYSNLIRIEPYVLLNGTSGPEASGYLPSSTVRSTVLITHPGDDAPDAGTQTPDAGPNPANVQVIGASAAPPSGDLHPGEQDVAFDQFAVQANQPVMIVSISYTFFRIWGASGLVNQEAGNHMLVGTRLHSDYLNLDVLTRGKSIQFYGDGCNIDLISEQFTSDCTGVGPMQDLDFQGGYAFYQQFTTYVNVSTQATADDSYIPTVTGVRYKIQDDDTVYTAPARHEGNLRRVSVP